MAPSVIRATTVRREPAGRASRLLFRGRIYARGSTLENESELLDYRRFLPSSVELSAEQHALVLDRFFMFFSLVGVASAPDRVLPRHGGTSSRVRTSARQALRTVLALPAQYRALNRAQVRRRAVPQGRKDRELFALRALSFLNEELERQRSPHRTSSRYQVELPLDMDEHTAGWTWFGLADRAAQTVSHNVTAREGSCEALMYGRSGLDIDCEPL